MEVPTLAHYKEGRCNPRNLCRKLSNDLVVAEQPGNGGY